MYFLKPLYHRTIWGGNRLRKYLPDCPEDLAHLYLASAHADFDNPVIDTNLTLSRLFEIKKPDWNMAQYQEFPLTLALVDATQNLSIQVHPDTATALYFENDAKGKTESWIFLEPPANGWIYCGMQVKNHPQFMDAFKNGKIEHFMTHYPVSCGDCVTVRSGIPHALTSGSLVFEVEFGSNYTYRLFDYNRRDKNGNARRLDLEKGLTALQLDYVPDKRKAVAGKWIKLPEYEIFPLQSVNEYENESNRLECLCVIEGAIKRREEPLRNCFCVLLEPGEKLENIHIKLGMAVRLGVPHGH